jgi:hypothetical protein
MMRFWGLWCLEDEGRKACTYHNEMTLIYTDIPRRNPRGEIIRSRRREYEAKTKRKEKEETHNLDKCVSELYIRPYP